jgi:hypothetical protein
VLLLGVGLLTLLAGAVGLGTIGFWYGSDMGWDGSGSTIVEPRAPILVAAGAAVASMLFGVVVLLVRRDGPSRRSTIAVLAFTGALMVVFVWVAVGAYPQVVQADLLAIRDDGALVWRADLPLSEVRGLRRETARTITIEGQMDRRGCDSQARSVTIDRATGKVLSVDALPTFYKDPSDIPPPPAPIEAERGGFEVVQGSAPFICSS